MPDGGTDAVAVGGFSRGVGVHLQTIKRWMSEQKNLRYLRARIGTKRDPFLKNEFPMRKLQRERYERLVAFVNRKVWWHVPPRDPNAYRKRGKFLASSFREAEFRGRPLDEPQKVVVARPLIGDEGAIERKLFGRCVSDESISIDARWRLDAWMKRVALAKGYDSILLMSPQGFRRFRCMSKVPRNLELNILMPA